MRLERNVARNRAHLTFRIFASFTRSMGLFAALQACSVGQDAPPGAVTFTSDDREGKSKQVYDQLFASLGPVVCLTMNEQTFGFPSDATLAPGVDFVGGYMHDSSLRLDGAALSVGEACKSAARKEACEGALAQPTDHEGGFLPCDECPLLAHIRTTKGDSVEVLERAPEDAVATYLPIDTEREAMARVAASRAYAPLSDCTGKDVVREPSGTFLVRAKLVDCDISLGGQGPYTRYTRNILVRVDPSGAMKEVASKLSTTVSQACPIASRRVP